MPTLLLVAADIFRGHAMTDQPQKRRKWRRWAVAAIAAAVILGAVRLSRVSLSDARLIELSQRIRFGDSHDEACKIMWADEDVVANEVFAPYTNHYAATRFYKEPKSFERTVRNFIRRIGFTPRDRYPVEVRFNKDQVVDQIRRGTEIVEAPLNVNQ